MHVRAVRVLAELAPLPAEQAAAALVGLVAGSAERGAHGGAHVRGAAAPGRAPTSRSSAARSGGGPARTITGEARRAAAALRPAQRVAPTAVDVGLAPALGQHRDGRPRDAVDQLSRRRAP